MSKIQIICTSPGMRRLGFAHPASAIYPADRWSETDLRAFRADPSFTVREVDEAENTTTADDFEIRVANEVSSRVAMKVEELQRQFDDAVSALVEEKVAAIREAQAENIEKLEKLEKLLALAQAKQEELLKQLEAAARAEAEKTADASPQEGGAGGEEQKPEEEKPKGKAKTAKAE